MPLPELETAAGVRWIDIHHAQLRNPRSLGALNRVCDGTLTQRMARDLATPRRFPTTGTYGRTTIRMTAAFLVRHLQPDVDDDGPIAPVASVLKPVQILVGDDWLLSAWLPPRLFRGSGDALQGDPDGGDPDRLHLAVAASWPDSGCHTADGLADLIRRELEVASGHRSHAV
ncbi:MAG TPA: hypothetical protein VKA47_12680 [Solirubrobacterales bacterium]|nr:hypothetical protein [Solirubrobacterales bacterium]